MTGILEKFLDNYGYMSGRKNRFGNVGDKAGNESLSNALAIAQNAGNVSFNMLPEGMQTGVMAPVNRALSYPVDMGLSGILGLVGGVDKAVGYGSEVFGGDPANEKRLYKDVMGGLEVAGFAPQGRIATALTPFAKQALAANLARRAPMGTVGGNLGNFGHNGGPALDAVPATEIIPDARPKAVPLYSASTRAAENLPQEKGSYEQMRAMLIKGGAKEDELEWSGFDTEFRDKGKTTKAGIIDYLENNAGFNMIDTVSDTADGILDGDSALSEYELEDRWIQSNLEEEKQYYLNDVRYEMLMGGSTDTKQFSDLSGAEQQDVVDEMGYDSIEDLEQYLYQNYEGDDTWMTPSGWGNGRPTDWNFHADEDDALDYVMNDDSAAEYAEQALQDQFNQMDIVEVRDQLGLNNSADTDDVQYADYFTPGGEDYTENRYQYVPPDADKRGGQFDQSHWSEPDNMVHTRTALFPVISGGKTHHVGEIQSDWGQQLRKQTERKAEYGATYRAKTFDEDRAEGETAISRDKIYRIQTNAQARFGAKIQRDENGRVYPDPDMKAAMFEYENGFKPEVFKAQIKPSGDVQTVLDQFDAMTPGEKLFNDYRPKTETISNFYLDMTNKHPEAVDFQSQYMDEYREAMNDLGTKGLPSEVRGYKEGGPIIGSTNKWVDFALRQELATAIAGGQEWMTFSSPKMASAMTMERSEGGEFYGKIVPQRMKDVLKKFDKKAKLEPVTIQTADGEQEVMGLRLTDDLVRKIAEKGGIPLFSAALAAQGPAAIRADEPNQSNGIMSYIGGI